MTTTQPRLITEARLGTLPELVTALTTRRARQFDFVAPAAQLRFADAQLVIDEIPAQLGADGVSEAQPGGTFRPLKSFDGLIASRLGVPAKWLGYCRESRPDLYDATVNGMLHGGTGADGTAYPGYPKKLLVRTFRGDPGELGYARAVLSDGYNPIDHLDIVATALQTISEMADRQIRAALRDATGLPFDDADPLTDQDRAMFAGLYPDGGAPGVAGGYKVSTINLTEDSMHLRVTVPGISGHAPVMTEGYQSPFRRGGATRWDGTGGEAAKRGDVVTAFVDFTNNEVGKGSYLLTPGYEILACTNGMTVPKWAIRTQHLGGRLEEGEIDWGKDTQRSALRTVMLKTRDAMRKFLDPGFLAQVIAETEKNAALPVSDPAETIKVVAATCQFTDDQAADILRMFTLGSQLTVGGVGNALTAASQVQQSPETAMEMDAKAMEAMTVAAEYVTAQAAQA
jgi:hypothetical protein